jgi:DNA-binding transcriptional ArsR family regulator
MPEDPDDVIASGDMALVHELRSVRELRALSNPLRVVVLRLLKERERSVKEMCELLGETSTRLYYHVRELERAGLVRHVRTETRDGSVLKFYRTTAMVLTIPFEVLHDNPGSPEARVAVSVEASSLERAARDVRLALTEHVAELSDDDYFVGRFFVRTTRERAREYIRRLDALHREFLDQDDDDGPIRYTITSALVPVGPAEGPVGSTLKKGDSAGVQES